MSAEISIILPDGKRLSLPRGTTGRQLAEKISIKLAKHAVATKQDGVILDLARELRDGARVEILTAEQPEAIEVLRHSSAHLLAQAVKRLFPEARFGVGPVIEDGFYYDLDIERTLSTDDLAAIEKEMHKAAQQNFPIERFELARGPALAWARERQDPYKEELIRDLPEGEVISFYQQGEFTDLCTGPHLPTTGFIKHFKLLSVAGAYWRGSEKNKMLQRIYGTSFFSAQELDDHLKRLEEAKRRDHRKLGKELDLFSFHPEAPAMPFFHPKGAIIYNELIQYVRGLYRRYGYQEVVTPQILTVDLWHRSGHYENYEENMYFTKQDEQDCAVKPMNCPGHTFIFASKTRSYRDLPIRIADFGRLHRYERSGVTAGLTRVRSFAQDDAHIFCAPDQIESEVKSVMQMILSTYDVFGFKERTISLATRPEKFIGTVELWEQAEAKLKSLLDATGHPYRIKEGDGAFYGPKIDFRVFDALRREWQLGTIQLDYQMPERFDLKFIAADGKQTRPVMIHRAMLGSLERFIGILIEHCGGDFPLWLAPVQAKILTVTDPQNEYAGQVLSRLSELGYRVDADLRNEKIGFKVREAELERVPYAVIIGPRETATQTVALRERKVGDRGTMTLDGLAAVLKDRLDSRM